MNNRYWIYGKHAVKSALLNPKRKKYKIILTKNSQEEFKSIIGSLSCKVVDKAIIEEEVSSSSHQGVALQVECLDTMGLKNYLTHKNQNDTIVALDQITDPQNVGAIIRSAVAFGTNTIIIPKDGSIKETGALAKAASGHLEDITIIYVTNLSSAFNELKKHGYWVVGLDGQASSDISEAKNFNKTVLVMGAEGKGLRRLIAENCDMLCKIRISEKVESLNVSNAATISLYELSKG